MFLLGERADRLRPFLLGRDGRAHERGLDRRGVAFLVAPARRRHVRGRGFPPNCLPIRDAHVGKLRGAGVRRSLLVFGVLLVHSLPEGFALGTAFASETQLALFVFLAIALQNFPEGTSVAIPMDSAGFGRSQQFWGAVLTSAPQPVGAVLAFIALEQITGLLAFSFAFAAGAMLSLVAIELLPQALARGCAPHGTLGRRVLAGHPGGVWQAPPRDRTRIHRAEPRRRAT